MASAAFTIGLLLLVIWVVFAVPTAIFLLRAYGRSKMSGFLWLFWAVVLWPAAARLLTIAVSIAGAGMEMAHFGAGGSLNFFTGLSLLETAIGAALVLTAAVVLERQVRERMIVPAAPAVPPPPSIGAL